MPTAEQLLYDKAKNGLQLMNPTDAYKTIQNQSPHKRNIMLLAEHDGLNRSAILQKFPKVPESVKEKVYASR